MPDVISVLERAAATPTRAPDVESASRRQRRTRLAVAAAAVVCAACAVFVIALVPSDNRPRVQVAQSPASTTAPAPRTVHSGNATIDVPQGWYTSAEPLAWWLHSPFELFSVSTVPLGQSRHDVGNDAACPSEIPRVAVEGLPDDGAYLWIGEWRPGEGTYQPSPRPTFGDGIVLRPGCDLPRGQKAYLGVYRDGTHDYSVTYVLGKDAPPARKADIARMLNSLRFDG